MAIAAGRRLADRLFSGKPEDKIAKVSYEYVPTVVFSHPVSGFDMYSSHASRKREVL